MATATPAAEKCSDAMTGLLKAIAQFDPYHMMLSAQRVFPLPKMFGIDFPSLTAIGEENLSSMNAAREIVREAAFQTARKGFEITNQSYLETFDAAEEISSINNPFDAAARQAEAVRDLFVQTSGEWLALAGTVRGQQTDVLKTLANRYILSLGKLKDLTEKCAR